MLHTVKLHSQSPPFGLLIGLLLRRYAGFAFAKDWKANQLASKYCSIPFALNIFCATKRVKNLKFAK
jgi:hypothetical protein